MPKKLHVEFADSSLASLPPPVPPLSRRGRVYSSASRVFVSGDATSSGSRAGKYAAQNDNLDFTMFYAGWLIIADGRSTLADVFWRRWNEQSYQFAISQFFPARRRDFADVSSRTLIRVRSFDPLARSEQVASDLSSMLRFIVANLQVLIFLYLYGACNGTGEWPWIITDHRVPLRSPIDEITS